ncbi:MAG: hypothetical protein RIC56_20585 [Pseudomonadales bacterium]
MERALYYRCASKAVARENNHWKTTAEKQKAARRRLKKPGIIVMCRAYLKLRGFFHAAGGRATLSLEFLRILPRSAVR